MARSNIPPQKLQEIREFAAQWGKIVARRAFGESGPGLEVDFQAMEEIAAAAAAGLTEGTFTTLLEQQAQAAPTPSTPAPTASSFARWAGRTDLWMSRGANSLTTNPSATVPSADGTFPPCGPCCVWTATATARRLCSRSLRLPPNCPRTPTPLTRLSLTGLQISPRHVCSIATEIGLELAAARDDKVARRQQRPTADAGGPATRGGRRGSRWRAGGHARAVLRPRGASTPAQGREDRLPGQPDRRQLRGRPPAGAAAVAGGAPAGPAAGPADPRLARGYDPGGRRARGYAATTGTSGGLVA